MPKTFHLEAPAKAATSVVTMVHNSILLLHVLSAERRVHAELSAVQLHVSKDCAACAQEPAVRNPMLTCVAFSAMARL